MPNVTHSGHLMVGATLTLFFNEQVLSEFPDTRSVDLTVDATPRTYRVCSTPRVQVVDYEFVEIVVDVCLSGGDGEERKREVNGKALIAALDEASSFRTARLMEGC